VRVSSCDNCPDYDGNKLCFSVDCRLNRHGFQRIRRFGNYYHDDEIYFSDAPLFQEIKSHESGYPKKIFDFFGERPPETLTLYGDGSLLEGKIIMVCGARNASESGTDLAYRCGRSIAGCGITVLSGYARGVDLSAHRGTLEGGGKTIAVLPYGLLRFRIHRDIYDSYDPSSFLVMSGFPMWQVFSTHAAFQRNKLMAALSDVIIVVEPGETGGTWYSAEKASKMGKKLFFLEGANPQMIPRLESLAGKRIPVVNGEPDLTEVLKEF
jgi:predicted Rossmann fold nucleotide-binding protein DprA/Smf involved in DNA uptake